jgi:hypothetical protein
MARLPDPALSRAVLIGTSDFSRDELLPNLPAVRNNLADLFAVLTDSQSGILSSEYCTIVDSPESPNSFMTRLKKAANQAEDLLLVYYSGHGIQHQTKDLLYLTVHGTDPGSLSGSAVPFEWVREVIEDSPARTRLLILDCCYSGMALGAMSGGDVNAREVAVGGTSVITSSPRNKISHSPAGERNTAFTAELLTLLRRGPRLPGEPLSVNVLYQSLRSAMSNRDLPLPKMKAEDTSGTMLLRRPPPQPRPVMAMPDTVIVPPVPVPVPVPVPKSKSVVAPEQPAVHRRPVVQPRPVAPRPAVAPSEPRQSQPSVSGAAATREPTPDADKVSGEQPVWRTAALDTSVRTVSLGVSLVLWVGLGLGFNFGVGALVGVIFGSRGEGSSVGSDIGLGVFMLAVGGLCAFLIRRRIRRAREKEEPGWVVASAYPALFGKLTKIGKPVLAVAMVFFIGIFFTGVFAPITPTKSTSGQVQFSPLGTQVAALLVMAELAAISGYLLFRKRDVAGP